MRLAWLVAFALAVLPAAASARIYKWVDDDGHTVFSNQPPATARLASRAQVIVEDDPAAAAREDAARRERELQERVASLERQLAAQRQYAAPAYYPAPPPQAMQYYEPAPYPITPYPIAGYSTLIVLPAHRLVHRFPPRPFAAFHHRGMHRR